MSWGTSSCVTTGRILELRTYRKENLTVVENDWNKTIVEGRKQSLDWEEIRCTQTILGDWDRSPSDGDSTSLLEYLALTVRSFSLVWEDPLLRPWSSLFEWKITLTYYIWPWTDTSMSMGGEVLGISVSLLRVENVILIRIVGFFSCRLFTRLSLL